MNIHGDGTPDIIQFGPYRSGSTFLYQYFKQLFPEKRILKYHAHRADEVPVVMTIRDYRDSVVSYWRIEYPERHGQKIILGESFMTKDDIDTYTEAYFDLDKVLHKYLITHSEVLVLKYELFFNNFEYLHEHISKFFGVDIPDEIKCNIEHVCSLDYNKKFQEKYDDFQSYDITKGIHGDHIFTGESIWKQVVPDELHGYFNKKLEVILNNWDYEIYNR